jgi:hypothetical protein
MISKATSIKKEKKTKQKFKQLEKRTLVQIILK